MMGACRNRRVVTLRQAQGKCAPQGLYFHGQAHLEWSFEMNLESKEEKTMKPGIAVILVLFLAAPAWADTEELFPTQVRGGRGGIQQGSKIWLTIETIRVPLEATDASGTDPAYNDDDDFNTNIDTFLQQSTSILNIGYQADPTLVVFAKAGYAYTSMIQDTGPGSIVGGPARLGGGLDPYFVYGMGLSYHQAGATKSAIFGRAEMTFGDGEMDSNYSFHSITGSGDLTFKRFEARVGFIHQMPTANAYVGVRYNLLQMEIKMNAAGGGNSFTSRRDPREAQKRLFSSRDFH